MIIRLPLFDSFLRPANSWMNGLEKKKIILWESTVRPERYTIKTSKGPNGSDMLLLLALH